MPEQHGYRQALFLHDRPVLLGHLMQGICVYDLIDQKQSRCAGGLIENDVLREAVSPDGRWIVAAARETVEALDLQNARRYTLEGHRGDITTFAFSPDSRFLISGSEDTTLFQWDLQSLKSGENLEEDAIVCCEGDIESLDVSPDGKVLAWGSSDLGVLDLEQKERLFHTGNASVHSVSFRRDGKKLAVAFANGAFEIRDVATGASDLAFPKVDKDGYSIAYAPDGNSILTSGNRIRVWSTASAAERFSWKGYSRPAAYSPDGRWIATAESFDTIAVHSSHDGRKLINLQYPSGEQTAAVGPILFTPDSRSVIWSSGKNPYMRK